MSLLPIGAIAKIYIAGQDLILNPGSITATPEEARASERFLDLTLSIDRPEPYEDAPVVTRKLVYSLPWASVKAQDNELLDDLVAYGGFFPFCAWEMVTESFAADGATTIFYLSRRLAFSDDGVPALSRPDDPAVVAALATKVYDARLGGSLIDPGDYSFGAAVGFKTPITFDAARTEFRVRYCPMPTMAVRDQNYAYKLSQKAVNLIIEER